MRFAARGINICSVLSLWKKNDETFDVACVILSSDQW